MSPQPAPQPRGCVVCFKRGRDCRCGLPALNARRVDGRCSFCEGSGFGYRPEARAYACLDCGGLKPEEKDALDEEQTGALREARGLLGARWRSKIREAWKTGRYPVAVSHLAPLLQQIRNRRSRALDEV